MFLQYGAGKGGEPFRKHLAEFLSAHYGFDVSASELCVTSGNSQALDTMCTLFLHADNDSTTPEKTAPLVVCENPTYFLAKGIFDDHGARTVGLPVDEHGMQVLVYWHLSLEQFEQYV